MLEALFTPAVSQEVSCTVSLSPKCQELGYRSGQLTPKRTRRWTGGESRVMSGAPSTGTASGPVSASVAPCSSSSSVMRCMVARSAAVNRCGATGRTCWLTAVSSAGSTSCIRQAIAHVQSIPVCRAAAQSHNSASAPSDVHILQPGLAAAPSAANAGLQVWTGPTAYTVTAQAVRSCSGTEGSPSCHSGTTDQLAQDM